EAEEKAEAACAEARPLPAPPGRLSVVDEAWELLDPCPDVQGLFTQFNETLSDFIHCESTQHLTLCFCLPFSCAGLCKYEGRSGTCLIRLSEPILKLRPRKNLVETLLHEMIHALLFVTNKDENRAAHGPEFHKHMNRINRLTGANVTVFHNFYDEVNLYRQHWWRCNGPCQYMRPFFGYVKRSMNRAPSAQDFWWAVHQRNCGGTFIKVKEPEKIPKKGKKKTEPKKQLKSKLTNKDKVCKDVENDPKPSSGNGYRLKEWESDFSEGSANPSSTGEASGTSGWQRPSAGSLIEISDDETEFDDETLGDDTVFPIYTSDVNEIIDLTSDDEFPEFSLADTKEYTDANKSRVKIGDAGEGNSKQGSAKRKRILPPFDHRSPKQIRTEESATAQAASKKKGLENRVQQWPRSEDKAAFKSYFMKKQSTDAASS
ncbi:SPRTN protein, partial [Alectura lathami]|nr:SPRTN protein [Alectura lathami]